MEGLDHSDLSQVGREPEGKKISTKFIRGCGAKRLLKSSSVTENSIAWKIKQKE